jgi:hypothetical protein
MKIEIEGYGLLSNKKEKEDEKEAALIGKGRRQCSSCGETLKSGGTICDVCGAALGETVSRLSDGELESRLRSARLISLLFLFAIPALVVAGLATVLLPPVTIACGIAAVICFFLSFSFRNKMKRLVSANIISGALSEVFEDCRYSHASHLPSTDIGAAMLIPKWDEISGSDLVAGKYRGKNVRFSDVKLVDVRERIIINGRNRDKRVTVFKGQWLVCELGRELPAPVRLSEKAFGLFNGKSDVETENSAFNNKFRILTSDPHTAFYILTPHFMDFILAADARADARVFLSFNSAQVHIALHNNKDSFELKGKKTGDIPALRTAIKKDVQYLLNILDELFQNDYLFAKGN